MICQDGSEAFCVFHFFFDDMSFVSSHLAVGDPLGDRFWLTPKKGEWQSDAADQGCLCQEGVWSRTGQQLCNNCSGLHREHVLCNSIRGGFFFFPFFFSLLNCVIHAACEFQVLAAV